MSKRSASRGTGGSLLQRCSSGDLGDLSVDLALPPRPSLARDDASGTAGTAACRHMHSDSGIAGMTACRVGAAVNCIGAGGTAPAAHHSRCDQTACGGGSNGSSKTFGDAAAQGWGGSLWLRSGSPQQSSCGESGRDLARLWQLGDLDLRRRLGDLSDDRPQAVLWQELPLHVPLDSASVFTAVAGARTPEPLAAGGGASGPVVQLVRSAQRGSVSPSAASEPRA